MVSVGGHLHIYTYMCVSLFVGFGRRSQATVDEKNTENYKTQTKTVGPRDAGLGAGGCGRGGVEGERGH